MVKDKELIDARFGRAVLHDHGECSDSTCDISAAMRAGYPRVAAYLLMGATEAPWCEMRYRQHRNGFDSMGHSTANDPDWLAWCQWFEANTVRCPSCEAFNFTDDGPVYSCGNCLAPLA